MMDNFGMLFCRSLWGLTAFTSDEDKLTIGMDSFAKSYMVKRRTAMGVALSVRLADLIISLAVFVFSVVESTHISPMIITIDLLLLIFNVIVSILVYKAGRVWNDLRLSFQYSKILAGFIIIVPILIAFIPAYHEVVVHHDTGEDHIEEDYSFDATIIQLVSAIIPVVTGAQNFVTSSNGLISDLRDTYELRFVRSIAVIIYCPIYLAVVMLFYNITTNYLVIIIGALYTIYLVLPFVSSRRVSSIIEWVLTFGMIALAISVFFHTIGEQFSAFILISMLGAIVGSYINYYLMSIVMIDLVCLMVIKYRESTTDTTDLFAIIIGNELTDDGYKKIGQETSRRSTEPIHS